MNKARILVVDDDPKLTAVVSFVLKRYGAFLVREENRSFAIPAALEFSPDLIIIDADMPGNESGDLAADLRQLPPFMGTPFIFLSALVASSANGRTGEVFLAKPVDATLLVVAVRRLLSPEPKQMVPRRRFLPRSTVRRGSLD